MSDGMVSEWERRAKKKRFERGSSENIPEGLVKKVVEVMVFNLKQLPEKDQREMTPKVLDIFTLPNVEERNRAIITYFREVFLPLVPGELKSPSASETANLYSDETFSSVLRFFSAETDAEIDNYYHKQILSAAKLLRILPHDKQFLIAARKFLKSLPQGNNYYPQNYDRKRRRERDLKRHFHKYKIVDKQKQNEIRKRLGFD